MIWICLLVVQYALGSPLKQEINVPIGQIVTVESPGYPEVSLPETNIIWELTTENNARIDIVCEELKISNDDKKEGCDEGYLKIFEKDVNGQEEKYCGSVDGAIATSKNNKITLELDLKYASGVVKCSAIGIPKDIQKEETINTRIGNEIINLEVGKRGYDGLHFPTLPKDMAKTWIFKTNPGARFSIFCINFKISNYVRCKNEEMKVTSGGKSKQFCGEEYKLEYQSDTNEMEVYIKTSDQKGEIDCIVQAINGPNKNQYMNEKSQEIDSKEYGGVKGPKSTNCNCGWANKVKKLGFANKNAARIVNGKLAKENEYPWIAALLSYRMQFCGGSIISKWHILTAAHCTYGKTPGDIQVLLGTNNWINVETGQMHQIDKIIDNDYVKLKAHVNDISILVSKTEFKFGPNVGPVCLTKKHPDLTSKYVTLIGWGNLGKEANNRQPERLRTTHMRVVDFVTCNGLYNNRFDREKPTRLCTWASNRDSCNGDSGGPLAWLDPETNRYTQMGLVSFGKGCNTNDPKINTLVSAYYDWIEQTVQSSKGEEICHKV